MKLGNATDADRRSAGFVIVDVKNLRHAVGMTCSPDDTNALGAEWDGRYAAVMAEMPSTAANAVLINEASDLPSGTALDIGCGLGAEAIWLASHGWNVTALDVSRVALEHAEARARQAGARVNWICASLEEAQLQGGGYDLVTAFYPALRHTAEGAAQKTLLAAIAPGGTLLVVHHANVDVKRAKSYGFDPADYLSHDDIVALLHDGWRVEVDRGRPRQTPAGPQGQHTHDDVVLARRPR